MKLICEYKVNSDDITVIEEQQNASSEKVLKIRGPYVVTEEENENGRVYDRQDMVSAINEYTEQFINTSRSVGELEHPDSIEISYDRACHLITSLKQEDNIWIGESKVLVGTPCGDILKGLLMNGVNVGISTRGVGDLDNAGNVTNFKFITADIVSNPSAGNHGAWCQGIFESKNFMLDSHGSIIESVYNKLESDLATLPKNSAAKNAHIADSLATFIRSLK